MPEILPEIIIPFHHQNIVHYRCPGQPTANLQKELKVSLAESHRERQNFTVGCTELLDGDQIHQYRRCKAVVGCNGETVESGEGENGGKGGEERNDGRDQSTDQHTDSVEDQTGHPLLVTQPTHGHLAHGVEDPDNGEDLGGLRVGDVEVVLHVLDGVNIGDIVPEVK